MSYVIWPLWGELGASCLKSSHLADSLFYGIVLLVRLLVDDTLLSYEAEHQADGILKCLSKLGTPTGSHVKWYPNLVSHT